MPILPFEDVFTCVTLASVISGASLEDAWMESVEASVVSVEAGSAGSAEDTARIAARPRSCRVQDCCREEDILFQKDLRFDTACRLTHTLSVYQRRRNKKKEGKGVAETRSFSWGSLLLLLKP